MYLEHSGMTQRPSLDRDSRHLDNHSADKVLEFWFKNTVLKLEYGNGKCCYFSWSSSPAVTVHDDVVSINGAYARALGLKDGQTVLISDYTDVGPVNRIHVSPLTEDDWAILMTCTDIVQSSLLEQLRVVWHGQNFVFCLSQSFQLVLCVDALESSQSIGRLEPFTEVVVSPPKSDLDSVDNNIENNVIDHMSDHNNISRLVSSADKDNEHLGIFTSALRTLKNLIFVTKAPFSKTNSTTPSFSSGDEDIKVNGVEQGTTNVAYARLCIFEDMYQDLPESLKEVLAPIANYSAHKCAVVTDLLTKFLGLTPGCRIVLEVISAHAAMLPTEIQISSMQPWNEDSSHMDFIFRRFLEDSTRMSALLLNNKAMEKLALAKVHWQMKFANCSLNPHTLFISIKSIVNILKALSQCVYYQPAVILFDDLDALLPICEGDEVSQDELYHSRLGTHLVELLEAYQSLHYITVMATATSIHKLHSSIISPRGQHIFKTILDIPEMDKLDRLEILSSIISQKPFNGTSSLDLDTVVNRTEGYVIQDLVDIVDKATFQSLRRSVVKREHPLLLDQDFEEAIDNFVPLSLQDVQFFHDSSRSWDDVGGLKDVKQILVEVLQWPSQYPDLYAQCPLRHQSGVLLYGAPGTGKTLLAGVVAHECGLKFISVKGPELLSKYIGASEEAVRNIFKKAQSAKPCVLFFDEFDSLAPRRGHDSTGVTDRVVNQLLTQLDGVESLQGVWVIAATSRPDLLDPALLRPGRLDRAVLCPLPDEDDRLSILKSLSRRLTLDADVDLKQLAAITKGFTGADLQAILYTAQLMTYDSKLSTTGEGMKYILPDLLPFSEEPASGSDTAVLDEETGPIITQAFMQAALKDTRPSLSPSEKHKYQKIEEERNTQEEIISTHLLFRKLSYMYEFTFLVLEAEEFNLCLLINVSWLDIIFTKFRRKENEPLHRLLGEKEGKGWRRALIVDSILLHPPPLPIHR
uniref:Peroxisomal ATPase PEX1 n=1 Tax=Timema cristinae TaxID=61476 RepID=A0A7R9H106_TIMCR|nr:unnamed protein product [Timema cristinae]